MLVLWASLVMVGVTGDSPIACNLNVLTPSERVALHERSERLKSAVVRVEEVADGYRIYFDDSFSMMDIAAWVEAERRCCPFLDFTIRFDRELGRRSLQLTGREGVKAFLAAEIPAIGAAARGR